MSRSVADTDVTEAPAGKFSDMVAWYTFWVNFGAWSLVSPIWMVTVALAENERENFNINAYLVN